MNTAEPANQPKTTGAAGEPPRTCILAAAVEAIAAAVRSRRKGYVCVSGVHGVIESRKDPDLRRIFSHAMFNVPDGMPLVWVGRARGFNAMDRVYGPALMLRLCERSVAEGWTHFLYGGKAGVAEELKRNLEARFPGIRIAGTYSPPFRPLNQTEAPDLAARLVARGHVVRAVLPSDGLLRSPLAADGVEVRIDRCMPLLTRRRMRSPLGVAQLLLRLPLALRNAVRAIREFRPDIVHTNSAAMLPAYGWAARSLGIPHVQHIRESFGEFGVLWRAHEWFLASASRRIIAVSAAMADQFGPRARHKTVVIHNGVPPEEFEGVTPERERAFRAAWGFGDAPLVGVVGRIKFQRKGQEVFVQAAARLHQAHPTARFPIIGSTFPGNEDHAERLRRLIAELGMEGRVVLTGDVEDIKAALGSLDILVLPSVHPEPFGGVVIEAMGLGKPVIGTRIGGTVEQVEDGVTGLLVAPNDPAGMAEAIDRLLREPGLRARMGAQGRARFLQRFQFGPFCERLLKLYAELTPPAADHPEAHA